MDSKPLSMATSSARPIDNQQAKIEPAQSVSTAEKIQTTKSKTKPPQDSAVPAKDYTEPKDDIDPSDEDDDSDDDSSDDESCQSHSQDGDDVDEKEDWLNHEIQSDTGYDSEYRLWELGDRPYDNDDEEEVDDPPTKACKENMKWILAQIIHFQTNKYRPRCPSDQLMDEHKAQIRQLLDFRLKNKIRQTGVLVHIRKYAFVIMPDPDYKDDSICANTWYEVVCKSGNISFARKAAFLHQVQKAFALAVKDVETREQLWARYDAEHEELETSQSHAQVNAKLLELVRKRYHEFPQDDTVDLFESALLKTRNVKLHLYYFMIEWIDLWLQGINTANPDISKDDRIWEVLKDRHVWWSTLAKVIVPKWRVV